MDFKDLDQVEYEDEGNDIVDDLQSRITVGLDDDQLTSVSRFSNKSVVVTLTKQLQEEKEARQKLEGELSQLMKVSS